MSKRAILNNLVQPHPQALCLSQLLTVQAIQHPEAVAITAPGRVPLTYSRLRTQVDAVVQALNTLGVGRHDRVGLVLPNGPEMAVAFLAVAAGAVSAPLNPAYRAHEFDFYLTDLQAKALVIQSDMDSPARAVAHAHGLPVLELSPCLEAEAGFFTLRGEKQSGPDRGGFAQPDEVALVLHTSGTTSRPKIVPLTHANLCTSAYNIRAALALGEQDRCLNVMPLFHIHGLIAAVLSSLAAGASVVCAPGFYAPRFFTWLEECRPTWYTAVPTMHQAILARAEANRALISRCPLRFIRSSSSALPPQVMTELEQIFDAPVIEAYGMTEACHQMTSNPLPPRQRKSGSVGVAAGPEVAIMDGGGNLLPSGERGEVVIRGANVTPGYENNPTANQRAFTHSWFRTGDVGFLDTEGYLFLTGRLKEIINRGGEKIAPREVDEVLMDHPAIAQIVTFAVPHARLGEEVAAAVVLRENTAATEPELREFAAARLADFKVPRQIVIIDEIPKGPTGKLQRIGLAEKLGLTAFDQSGADTQPPFTAPRTPLEERLAEIWAQVLEIERVGIYDDFFQLGGDSILAAQLLARVRAAMQVELPVLSLFEEAFTVARMAEHIHIAGTRDGAPQWSSLVPIQPEGTKPPLFLVHGGKGQVLFYRDLARYLGPEQPVYGLQTQGLHDGLPFHERIEDMAAHYLGEIRTVQPEGPYLLGGRCFGCFVALEMAQQLRAQGQDVALLALMDPVVPPTLKSFGYRVRYCRHNLHRPMAFLLHILGLSSRWTVRKAKKGLAGVLRWVQARYAVRALERMTEVVVQAAPQEYPGRRETSRARRQYRPQVYPGRVTCLVDGERARLSPYPWPDLVSGGVEWIEVPGHKDSMFQAPQVQEVAEKLRSRIEAIQVGQLSLS